MLANLVYFQKKSMNGSILAEMETNLIIQNSFSILQPQRAIISRLIYQ